MYFYKDNLILQISRREKLDKVKQLFLVAINIQLD